MGMSSYMNCICLLRLSVRFDVSVIFRPLTGSRVSSKFISLVLAQMAGEVWPLLSMSHPRSLAVVI